MEHNIDEGPGDTIGRRMWAANVHRYPTDDYPRVGPQELVVTQILTELLQKAEANLRVVKRQITKLNQSLNSGVKFTPERRLLQKNEQSFAKNYGDAIHDELARLVKDMIRSDQLPKDLIVRPQRGLGAAGPDYQLRNIAWELTSTGQGKDHIERLAVKYCPFYLLFHSGG